MRLALLASLCAAVGSAQNHSTVSVYLPEYGHKDWAALRGSVISSDEHVTAYTVFCADQAGRCRIAGDIPFVFTEGVDTLIYKGADPGTVTANLECDLAGKTAATCTGSTAFGAEYRGGPVTGPTETTWTSTFTASQVTWGVLTLSTPGPDPLTTDIEGIVGALPTGTPVSTSGAGRPLGNGQVVMAALGAVLVGALFG